MIYLEEEHFHAKRVGRKKDENRMGNLPLCYTILKEKTIPLRCFTQMLLFFSLALYQ
jgi:hypothetical protein